MAAIAGKYSFVSQDKFDDWLKAVGKYPISIYFFRLSLLQIFRIKNFCHTKAKERIFLDASGCNNFRNEYQESQ